MGGMDVSEAHHEAGNAILWYGKLFQRLTARAEAGPKSNSPAPLALLDYNRKPLRATYN